MAASRIQSRAPDRRVENALAGVAGAFWPSGSGCEDVVLGTIPPRARAQFCKAIGQSGRDPDLAVRGVGLQERDSPVAVHLVRDADDQMFEVHVLPAQREL